MSWYSTGSVRTGYTTWLFVSAVPSEEMKNAVPWVTA
jgi:hypothetical protein